MPLLAVLGLVMPLLASLGMLALLGALPTAAGAEQLPFTVGGRVGLHVAGLAFEDLPAGFDSDSRLGFIAAAFMSLPLHPVLAAETGLGVSTQGADLDGTLQFGNLVLERGRVKLVYVNLPLLLRVTLPGPSSRPYLRIGPQLGILASAKAEVETSGSDAVVIEQDIGDDTSALDFTLLVAGGLEFPVAGVRGFVELGYGLGMTHVFEDGAVPEALNAKNQGLTLVLGLSY